MSHPDPLHDEDNMNYDDHDDFYGESADYSDYNDDRDYDDENSGEVDWDYNDSMDGDRNSAMASAGHGTDEDYGYYGDPEDSNDYGYDDREDFHSDDGYGYYDDGE